MNFPARLSCLRHLGKADSHGQRMLPGREFKVLAVENPSGAHENGVMGRTSFSYLPPKIVCKCQFRHLTSCWLRNREHKKYNHYYVEVFYFTSGGPGDQQYFHNYTKTLFAMFTMWPFSQMVQSTLGELHSCNLAQTEIVASN